MSNCPEPVRESDENVCLGCRMRWDACEGRPDCPKQVPPETTDREKLEQIASCFRELQSLQNRQRVTAGLMIRTCVTRLWTSDSRRRKEAIEALLDLANLMEKGTDA